MLSTKGLPSMIEVMTLADKIVVLNHGRIEQQGSPIEQYRNPANLFVAGFIGSPSMNILNGIVKGVDGSPTVRLSDGTAIGVTMKRQVKHGQTVVELEAPCVARRFSWNRLAHKPMWFSIWPPVA
ncbi:hypothetical protein [Phyllobacterium sp. K27]